MKREVRPRIRLNKTNTIIFALSGLIAISLIVLVVLLLRGKTYRPIVDTQQSVIDNLSEDFTNNRPEDIDAYFSKKQEESTDIETKNSVTLVQIHVLLNNSRLDDALSVIESVDDSQLTVYQKLYFYSNARLTYDLLGDIDLEADYRKKAQEQTVIFMQEEQPL